MAEKSKEADYFTPGSQVRVETMTGLHVQGEVVGFDEETLFLFLKRPMPGQHERSDLTFINTKLLKKVENVGEDVAVVPPPLPYVPIPKVTSRMRANVLELKRQKNYVGENVSAEGQMLMDSISKTISEVKWDNDVIVVMESVVITPPYTVNQLRIIPGKENAQNNTTLAHLRKMVEKHQQDERSRLAHSQNNTRRSTSPSPAPSSSSTSSAS
ncbi:hypothetical protein ACOMHN_052571 [Nucella lapillus]